jgi:hypothetical protein
MDNQGFLYVMNCSDCEEEYDRWMIDMQDLDKLI